MYLVTFSGSAAYTHVVWSIDSYQEVRRIRYQAAKVGVKVRAVRHW